MSAGKYRIVMHGKEKTFVMTGEYVEIAITDRGRGLGGASQTSLTKRFGRGGNVADIVGSGLGLTIVEEVAQAHGGHFDLKQQPEGGTCAVFSLPRH